MSAAESPELNEARARVVVALAMLGEVLEAESGTNIGRYRAARYTCELCRLVLEQHDLPKLLQEIDRADTVGAIVDPTLYRSKIGALLEDREVFSAALRFRGVWKKPEARQ